MVPSFRVKEQPWFLLLAEWERPTYAHNRKSGCLLAKRCLGEHRGRNESNRGLRHCAEANNRRGSAYAKEGKAESIQTYI